MLFGEAKIQRSIELRAFNLFGVDEIPNVPGLDVAGIGGGYASLSNQLTMQELANMGALDVQGLRNEGLPTEYNPFDLEGFRFDNALKLLDIQGQQTASGNNPNFNFGSGTITTGTK